MKRSVLWLSGAFSAGAFAVAIPYWQVPYSKLSLPDSILGPTLLVPFVAASISRGFGKCRFLPTLLSAGAAVPCAVMARVVFDGWQDPTTHNLWPFELIIAAGIGLAVAGSGALVGSIPALISRVPSRHDT